MQDITPYLNLLKELISTPSYSRQEDKTADILQNYLQSKSYETKRSDNNVWVLNKYFDCQKPTVLLCSHHDTVREKGYTIDPFSPIQKDSKLYGLGSNDAGASLVGLIAVFDNFYASQHLKYNLCLLLSAEEEVSGACGIESVKNIIPKPHFAVIGEPTDMNVAISERGLMVLDCRVEGVSGHAAHSNTINPIHTAISDLQWFSTYKFDKISSVLGEVKMSVTIICAGSQHNVIPNECTFTVDIRSNGMYTNEDILQIVKQNVNCCVKARSTRLSASSISRSHPFVECCTKCGSTAFGSSTLSDQALLDCDSVKIGIGSSERSHKADEFIYLQELQQGIDKYLLIFNNYLFE